VKKLAQISLAFLMIAALGLSQIAAGFLHNEHDAHKSSVLLPEGHFAITPHGEHCKLCAIDLITLYNVAPEHLALRSAEQHHFTLPIIKRVSVHKTFASDRAPPAHS
jgi:hypothetical protein